MRRATKIHSFVWCVVASGLLAGCAAPGDPSPRHPVVPVPVADLAGRQFGSSVVLTFTVPNKSMDRESLSGPPAIEVYRANLPLGVTAGKTTAWRLVYSIPSERVDSYVKNGHFEFTDPLTSEDLARAAGSSLAYVVRTRAARTRASENSNILAVKIYSPPTAPGNVQVSVTESAILVSWDEAPVPAGASAAGYRVYRAEIEPGEAVEPGQDISSLRLKSPPELDGSSSSTTYRDPQFKFDKAYVYTVRNVAQFGSDSVESSDSVPVSVTPRDTFPPAAPVGLESTVILATPQAPAYVELSWGISPEGDLAGYYVYRSDSEDSPGERINSQILLSPTFRDMSVVSGKRYFYRVSAVDRAGNESPKSSAVQTNVP